MNARGLTLASLVAISGCSGLFVPSVPADIAQKRNEIEALVRRHGFTCAGHPSDEPVMMIGIHDELFDCETLLELRRCELRPFAYSYKRRDDGGITFVFRQDREPHKAHLAGIAADGSFWVNDALWDISDPGFTRLPANNSIERTRGE
jgi:hypothetical protein